MFHRPTSSPQRIRIFGCFEAIIVPFCKFNFVESCKSVRRRLRPFSSAPRKVDHRPVSLVAGLSLNCVSFSLSPKAPPKRKDLDEA